MSIWLAVLAGVVLVGLACGLVGWRWWARRAHATGQRLGGDRTTPDAPIAFGHEITWLALRAEHAEQVADALELAREAREVCNWAHGLHGACGMSPRIFITPLVRGWTLALGSGLPVVHDPKDVSHFKAWLVGLSRRFGDVQYFASHAGASHFGWARADAGEFLRGVSLNHGQIAWNEGAFAEVEHQLGVASDAPEAAKAIGEHHVQAVAADWSLDPTSLEQVTPSPGVGMLVRGWVNLDTRAR